MLPTHKRVAVKDDVWNPTVPKGGYSAKPSSIRGLKGKNKGVVMTAVGRELLGFIWAIGIQVEAAQKEPLQRAA
jgi:hypothetical protein